MNYELNNDIAVLHFDDGKANAIGHEFIDNIEQGLKQAEQEAKAVIILGKEKMFSAGFDLTEINNGPAASKALIDRGAKMLLQLFSHPQPVVAGCTGHAIAAGALLLLAADTRLSAAGSYKIGLNETAIGLTLPTFGIELAHARLAKRHITAAVIQAQLYSPTEAVDVGFIDEVVDQKNLQAACIKTASQLSELPTATYAAMKYKLRKTHINRIKQSITA
ncbi:MAG: crotonase/enoyl-CoA hydratase family protein [Pseudomonadales bacterium]|nr:crotonase/enoyl-CoA hydratase family protein [Pseudomonadales bacterium]